MNVNIIQPVNPGFVETCSEILGEKLDLLAGERNAWARADLTS